jgi:HSP20 family molecular chaperone IbpA
MPESDDIFKDLWNDEFFKELMGQGRRMEHSFMEHIERLQEAIKSGKLRGRTKVVPIERPGVKGYIFHGVFGTPDTLEGENETPELDSEGNKNKEDFTLPETVKQDLRQPVVETFTNGDEFVAVVELPGVEEHELKVVTRNGSIQVGALNFSDVEIDVPSNADTDKKTQTLKNGVLEIRISLTSEKAGDMDPKFGVV